jgi:mRNA interferase MazF
MPTFECGSIVRVPFPYTDRPVVQRRPALVLSNAEFARRHGLLWVLMITSAANVAWAGDVPIVDFEAAGLPAPSVVRTAKIATIHSGDAGLLGTLDDVTLGRVWQAVRESIGVR